MKVSQLSKTPCTAQKMKFSIKDFFSKCDQIRRKLRIWSHLLKKSLMENFIFCAVLVIHWMLKIKCSDECIFDLFQSFHIPVSNINDFWILNMKWKCYVLSLPFFPGGSQILVLRMRRQLSD